MGNQICYGLQYIPNHTGTLTSYTTGFFIDCSTSGNPVVSNHSCIMTDNSLLENGCVQFGLVKINSSGNTGSLAVTQNVPIYIHQVCFTIPTGEYLDIVEDVTTDLTTSIDLTNNGGPITEFPGFTPAVLNWNQECIVLPLTWLDFQARRYDELVSKLDWSTADEINTAYFEVQRSNDNGRNFQTIGRVEATSVPTAVNAYQFMDRKALTGKNYYRIRQVDYDGRYDFSPIRTVTFATGKFAAKAWPNPASEEMTITIDHAVRDGRVLLVDFTGRQVREIDFNAGSTSHTLTVNDLQPGMYTLLISSGDDRLVEKIVIMK
jgi:hypothetical protein